ncbi:MAG: hypothetical protein J3Q66DRAFT_438521 [Benniella sp.]|nr:MAG: hypothetical protein J3Q66DRAFT_438521 [Benniella sp.]
MDTPGKTLFFIHPPAQSSPPAPTQQQVAQLQFQLAQSQQREEQLQLQLEVMRQDLWLQQFKQQQLYRQQQQQFLTQNAPPSQESLLMNNGSLASTQPWTSELLPLTIQPESLAPQSLAPAAMIDGNRMETERPDRVMTRRKSEGKRLQKRLTDEQWRDIMSRREANVPASYQTIANEIGCSKSTAWRQRKKYETQTKLIQKDDSQ